MADVLILYSGFGLSYEEVADALGLRVATVRSRLSRGRVKLRELLADTRAIRTDDQQESTYRNQVEGHSR